MIKNLKKRAKKVLATTAMCSLLLPMAVPMKASAASVTTTGDACVASPLLKFNFDKSEAKKPKVDLIMVADGTGSQRDQFPSLKTNAKGIIDDTKDLIDTVHVYSYAGDLGVKLGGDGKLIKNDDGSSTAPYKKGERVVDHTKGAVSDLNKAKQAIDSIEMRDISKSSTNSIDALKKVSDDYLKLHGGKVPKDHIPIVVHLTDGFPNVEQDGWFYVKKYQGVLNIQTYPSRLASQLKSVTNSMKKSGIQVVNAINKDLAYLKSDRQYGAKFAEFDKTFMDAYKAASTDGLFFQAEKDYKKLRTHLVNSIKELSADESKDSYTLQLADGFAFDGNLTKGDKSFKVSGNKITANVKELPSGKYSGEIKLKVSDGLKAGEHVVATETKTIYGKATKATVKMNWEGAVNCDPTISKVVSDDDEKRVKKATLQKQKEAFTFNLPFNPGYTLDKKSVKFVDVLNEVIDKPSSVKLLDGGKDVTKDHGEFSVTFDEKTDKYTVTYNFKDAAVKTINKKNLEVEIKSTLKQDDKYAEQIAQYISTGGVPNKGEIHIDNKPVISNEVKVVPPSEGPKLNKTVSDEDEKEVKHATLGKRDEVHEWKVDYSFGNNTANWKSVVLQDKIEDVLTIIEKDIKVVDQKGEDVQSLGELKVNSETNVVTFTIKPNENGKFTHLTNKKISLVIPSLIKKDVTDKQLFERYGSTTVPNKGELVINNDPLVSNEVDVTPPSKDPELKKTVSDADEKDVEHATLGKRDETHVWKIDYSFGNTVAAWKSVVLKDKIEDVLLVDVKGIKVVDSKGKDVTNKGTIALDEKSNTVTFTLKPEGNAQFGYLAGETYSLTIPTKIKKDVTDKQLFDRYGSTTVPNKGELVINNKPTVSNEVDVTPPSEKPTLKKTVSDDDEKNVEHATLGKRDETQVWNVNYFFGNDTSSWKTVVLKDKLEDVLTIQEKGIKVVDEDGKDVKNIGELKVDSKTNVVTFTIKPNEKGSYSYLTGKEINLIIPTNIKKDVTNKELYEKYGSTAVPNKGELVINDKPSISNEVDVTPPSEKPGLKKTVSDDDEKDVEHATLEKRDETQEWKVDYTFGNDVRSWKSMVLQDKLEDVLKVDIKGVKVVDSKGEDVTDKGSIDFDEKTNTVAFTLKLEGSKGFAYLVDETYSLIIPTKIKEDVTNKDLYEKYGSTTVPNKGELVINDKPTVSNEVDVTPPEEKPELKKTVSDSDEKEVEHATLSKRDETQIWKVDYNFGNNPTKWESVVLQDKIEDVLVVDVEKIDVVNAAGESVQDKGELTFDEKSNTVTFSLNAGDNGFLYLVDEIYSLIIPTKIKEDVSDKDLYEKYGSTTIPNKGELVINDEPTVSNEVDVKPPVDAPELKKTVSDDDEKNVEHAALAKRDEVQEWKVDYSFGNEVVDWTSVVLKDEIEDVLLVDADSIKVIDAQGEDVSGKGTLSFDEKSNTVTFTLKADEKSGFAFLVNETYSLIIPSTIKADVTDEELVKKYSSTTVPNIGELVINDKPIQSNEVDVTPPEPDPEPEQPVEPTPEQPQPEQPQPEQPQQPEEPKPTVLDKLLPKTGDSAGTMAIVVGVLIMLASAAYYISRRRKASK